MFRSTFILALFPLVACDGSAQRRSTPEAADNGSSTIISGMVGAKKFEASGPGRCRHTPEASIYSVPAALWMVEYSNSDNSRLKQLNLTLWRPKDGSADQISLSLETGSTSHRINTGGRGDQIGDGKVTLTPSGAGGRFEIKGNDATGTRLDVAITCPAFAGIEAEGG
ncbi:MAG: hypothetical protein ACREMZ_07470 [Gemmatimonadales bacterium]